MFRKNRGEDIQEAGGKGVRNQARVTKLHPQAVGAAEETATSKKRRLPEKGPQAHKISKGGGNKKKATVTQDKRSWK